MATDQRNLPAYTGRRRDLPHLGARPRSPTRRVRTRRLLRHRPTNLSTIVRSSANTFTTGYRIWRFADTLHTSGGKQVYIKLTFGNGSPVDRPALRSVPAPPPTAPAPSPGRPPPP